MIDSTIGPKPYAIPPLLCFLFPELRAETNQSKCHNGYRNNVLVYKVEPVRNDSDDIRTIAIERSGLTEIELQTWKTVGGNGELQRKTQNVDSSFRRVKLLIAIVLTFITLAEDLQLLDIAEVERRNVTDRPESYTLLATVAEGWLIPCSTLSTYVCIQ